MLKPSKFKGKVFSLNHIAKAKKTTHFLEQYILDFKDYWFQGFSPNIGKDIATSFPNPPEGHRHTHLRTVTFPSKEEVRQASHLKYSDTKACWDKWGTIEGELAQELNTNQYPTSDSCLFYLVDSNRNAYIFHYQADDSHEFMRTSEFKELVIKSSQAVENSGAFIMDWSEHNSLFDKKWLE